MIILLLVKLLKGHDVWSRHDGDCAGDCFVVGFGLSRNESVLVYAF